MDGNERIVEVIAAATVTSDCYSTPIDLGTYVRGKQISLFQQTSTVSGTMDIAIQESVTTTTGFAALDTAAAFTQIAAGGSEQINCIPKKRYIRLAFDITGTSGATWTGSVCALLEKLIA